MKTSSIIIFYSVFFTVYGLLNLYIFVRGWQVLPAHSPLRMVYAVVMPALMISFILGRTLESYNLSIVSEALIWTGSFWFAAMLYVILFLLGFDVLRLVDHFFGILPAFVTAHYETTKQIAAMTVVAVVLVLIAAGYVNASTTDVRMLDLDLEKRANGGTPLHLVVASDIHLGTIIGRTRLERLVETINGLHPDIILLPGDIVDEDLAPVIAEDLGSSLRKLEAQFGVYAVTGNHEFIGGVEEACRYLSDHGITILRDRSVALDNGLVIVGREDRSIAQFTGNRRRSLSSLMAGVDTSCPVILMDHQPIGLREAQDGGIDLQLSGHTHHGQLWPLSVITRMVYEVSWGYLRKDHTHYFVSCGVGTWGPPVRIGNRPEIISITLRFR